MESGVGRPVSQPPGQPSALIRRLRARASRRRDFARATTLDSPSNRPSQPPSTCDLHLLHPSSFIPLISNLRAFLFFPPPTPRQLFGDRSPVDCCRLKCRDDLNRDRRLVVRTGLIALVIFLDQLTAYYCSGSCLKARGAPAAMTGIHRFPLLPILLQILFGVCRGIQQFEETPQYTEVNPGQDAKLICRVLGKRGQCIWQKDQKPIGMHLKKYEWVGAPDRGDCSLWVRSAALEFDDGLWQCQVTASDFTTQDALASEPARLVVRVSPQRPQIEYADRLLQPGGNVTARAGEIATLTCRARYGNPPPLIKWYVGETEVRTLMPQVNSTEVDNPRTWSTSSVCEIMAERSRYGQPIRCVAIHPAYANPSMSSSMEVRFDVRYAPQTRLVGVPAGQLEEGRDQLEIRCLADANPPAAILWRKTKSQEIAEVASIGEALIYSPIHRNHAAVYICEASNTEGESSPVSVKVSVNYPPSISSVGPDRLTTALLYSGASFECHADAMPPATYRWAQVFTDGRMPLECGTGNRLILTNVTYEQQGQYICLASNKINGNVREVKSDPVSLQVVGAPRVVKPTITEKFVVVTTEGSPARLEIRLCSDPKPRLVAWEWGSTRLHAGEVLEPRYRALDLEPLALEDCYNAILELTSTVKEDQRLYHVIVENDRGSDRRVLMLRVDEPGQIPLVIGAVAGFTVLSVLVMGFVCFLRSDRCCVARNTVPALQQVHCTKASNTMIEDPRLTVDTMERASQQFVSEKRPNHVLKPVPSQQYPQECYQHEAQQQHYQRHHHHHHGPQYAMQGEQLFLKPDRLATLKPHCKIDKPPQYTTFKPSSNN